MSPKHSDTTPGWINREFAAIKKQMSLDRAAKKLQAATIGKGGLTIQEGGSFSATYPNGVAATRFGPYTEVGTTNTGYGLFVNDEAGTFLFGAIHYPGLAFSAVQSTVDFYATGDNFIVAPVGGAVSMQCGPISGVTLDGGTVGVHITHSTTGASANCFIDPSDNRIWRSTSSRRYKQDIEDAEVDPAAVLGMQARTWRDKGEVKNDADTETRYVGFIAEELDELGLDQFVVYDADHKPEAIAYDRLSVALLAVLKDLNARVAALEAEAAKP